MWLQFQKVDGTRAHRARWPQAIRSWGRWDPGLAQDKPPGVACAFPPGGSALGVGVVNHGSPLPSLVTVHCPAPDIAPVFSWLLGRAGVNFANSFLLLPTDACVFSATRALPWHFPGKEGSVCLLRPRESALPSWEPFTSIPQAHLAGYLVDFLIGSLPQLHLAF